MTTRTEDPAVLALLADEIAARLDRQNDTGIRLEAKAGAAAAVALVTLFGLLLPGVRHPACGWTAVGLCLVALLAAGIAAAPLPHQDLDPRLAAEKLGSWPLPDVHAGLIGERVAQFEHDARFGAVKAWCAQAALAGAWAGLVVSIAARIGW